MECYENVTKQYEGRYGGGQTKKTLRDVKFLMGSKFI